ncbi:hypothetical protein OG705_29605 [Streptomyces sp. NBC_00838]|nr:hypothetical protein OG705_29605 [Streptomyces sp. NBC_00838]
MTTPPSGHRRDLFTAPLNESNTGQQNVTTAASAIGLDAVAARA